jgi:hypothetical protein
MLKRHLANVLLLVGSCLAALLAVEVGLRALGISYPRYDLLDENIGDVLRPGVEWWWRSEGQTYVRINSQGLRDREHTLEKPPNTLRIAVLGDSYAEAFQVPVDRTFWAVLEREMTQCAAVASRAVEVINFGVSGYGTARELLTLRHRVWQYSPDIVVLAVLTGNDFTNNSRALENNARGPYFVFRDGELVLDNSFREQRSFRIRRTTAAQIYYGIYNRLRVLQVVNNARQLIQSRFVESTPPAAGGSRLVGSEPGLDNEIYREPTNDDWREAWSITETLVAMMNDEVEAKGAQFFVTTLSNGIQVHPDAATRQQFMNHLGIDNLFYPDHRLARYAARAGISMMTLAPELQRYATEHGIYLHGFDANLGFGHWNERGHSVAGSLIAQKLCKELFDPDTAPAQRSDPRSSP